MSRTRRQQRLTHAMVITSMVLFLAVGLLLQHRMPTREQITAGHLIEQAWHQTARSSQVAFASTIQQTTSSRPALQNVGQSPHTEYLYLEGRTNVSNDTATLRLWSQGGSITRPDTAIEIRSTPDGTYARRAGQAWQPLEGFNVTFAPQTNPASFLQVTRNAAIAEPITHSDASTNPSYTRITFDLDSHAYAHMMREKLQEQQARQGRLPVAAELEIPAQIADARGDGEVWITPEGLPLRLIVNLEFPATTDGQRITARVQTDFRDFTTPAPPDLFREPTEWFTTMAGVLMAQLQAGAWNYPLLVLLTLSTALLSTLVLIRYRQHPAVQIGFTSLMILAMVTTPVLQGQRVHAITSEQQAEHRQKQAEAAAEAEYDALFANNWDPQQPPQSQLAASSAAPSLTQHIGLAAAAFPDPTADLPRLQQNQSTPPDSDGDGLNDGEEQQLGTDPQRADSDGDGLNDGEEQQLGTDPLSTDSDGDGITDATEVEGFAVARTPPTVDARLGHVNLTSREPLRWYTNPLDPDSNSDGLLDGVECPAQLRPNATDLSPRNTPCDDTDGDGLPDVFDDDNENDGVPDIADLSPSVRVQPPTGGYGEQNPFRLSFDLDTPSDQPVHPLLVDVQLRPTNPRHLNYALNVLDWPTGDSKGMIQRIATTTFASDNPQLAAADPRTGYGDMRLIPMLEITIPFKAGHPGNLPVKPSWKQPIQADTPLNSWLLTDTLDAYGVLAGKPDPLRGDVQLYAPLNLVTNDGEGENVAFQARIPYLPTRDDWGNAHELRLVWAVQMQHDICPNVPDQVLQGLDGATERARAAEQWCADPTNRTVLTSIIHHYYDQWQLTGLEATEDYGLQSLIIHENPATDASLQSDGTLLAFAEQLMSTFLSGHDGLAREGNDDATGRRSVTAASLQQLLAQGGIPDWGIPNDTFTVASKAYTYGDQGLVQQLTTDARAVLQNFDTFPTREAALLFATETSYRRVNLDQASQRASSDATSYTLLFNGNIPKEVETALRVLPYRKDPAGSQWQAIPLTEYWNAALDKYQQLLQSDPELLTELRDSGVLAEEDQRDAILGYAAVLRALSLTLYNGIVTVPEVGGVVRTSDPSLTVAKLKNPYVGIIKSSTKPLISISKTFLKKTFETFYKDVGKVSLGKLATSIGKYVQGGFDGVKDSYVGIWGKGFSKGKWLDKGWAKAGKTTLGKRAGAAGVVTGAVLAVGVAALTFVLVASLILTDEDANLEKVVARVFTGVNLLMSTTSFIAKLYDTLQGVFKVYTPKPFAITLVGILIDLAFSLVVTWGLFMGLLIATKPAFFSLAFNAALAGAIAATIVAVALATILLIVQVVALLIPILGLLFNLALAFISLLDATIGAICTIGQDVGIINKKPESTLDEVVRIGCGGINGFIRGAVQFAIYGVLPGADFSNPDRLNIGNYDLNIVQPARGLIGPNKIRATLVVTNTIGTVAPPSSIAEFVSRGFVGNYAGGSPYVREELLRYTDVEYAFATDPNDRSVANQLSRGGFKDSAFWKRGRDFDAWRVVGNEQFAISQSVAAVLDLPPPGVNQPTAPLYLAEGVEFPILEAWGPAAYVRWEKSSGSFKYDQPVFDVLPSDLPSFMNMVAVNGGYAPAWTQQGTLPFQRQLDSDGDGLVNRLDGGSDPDDRTRDSDGDGLDDDIEARLGSDALLRDSDNDQLSDYEEVLRGTNLRAFDTDGDGLSDYEEVVGWRFVYNATTGAATWVTSDPLRADSDSDGLTDRQERNFGLHPQVASDSRILVYQAAIRETNAPIVLLPFDEPDGAATFADQSGEPDNARCTTCPTAGLQGSYGNSVRFDSAAERLTLTDVAIEEGQAVSVAAWVRPQSLSGSPQVLVTDNTGMVLGITNGQYSFGSAATNTFARASIPPADADQWVHLAGTYDGTTLRLYRNGQEVARASTELAVSTERTTWYIGADPTNQQGFFGSLDELLLFDRAIDAPTIQRVQQRRYNPDDALVTEFDSLTVQGEVFNDLPGNRIDGTLRTSVPSALVVSDQVVPQTFSLAAGQSQSLRGQLQIAPTAASGQFTVTQVAGGYGVDPTLNPLALETTPRPIYQWNRTAQRNTRFTGQALADYPGRAPGNNFTLVVGLTYWGSSGSSNAPDALFGNRDSNALSLRLLPPDGSNRTINDRTLEVSFGGRTATFPEAVDPYAQTLLIVTFDGTTLRLYTQSYSGNSTYSPTDMRSSFIYERGASTALRGVAAPQANPYYYIGQASAQLAPGELRFRGDLDDIVIYDRALPPAEVARFTADLLYHDAVLGLDDPPASTSFVNATGGVAGTCSGASCPTATLTGIQNGAMRFDGRDDYLRLPLDVSENGYTVSFWFRTSDSNAGLYSVTDGAPGASSDRDLYLRDGNLCARVWLGGSYETLCSQGTNYADNQWHRAWHTIGNQSDAERGHRLFVDSQMVAQSQTTASAYNTQNTVLLGYAQAASRPFLSGSIDDVRIAHRFLQPPSTLDDDDVNTLRVSFEEPFGTASFANTGACAAPNARCGKGTVNQGPLFGDFSSPAVIPALACDGASCPQAGREGRYGSAVQFDGTDDMLLWDSTTNTNDQHIDTASFSTAFWARRARTGTREVLLSHLALWRYTDGLSSSLDDLRPFTVGYLPTGELFCRHQRAQIATPFPIAAGQWNHIVCVRNSFELVLYLNGAQVARGTFSDAGALYIPPPISPDSREEERGPLVVGAEVIDTDPDDDRTALAYQNFFRGGIDEVRIFDGNLDESQVRQLYALEADWFEDRVDLPLTLDVDAPTATIQSNALYRRNAAQLLDIRATDPSSQVALVELSQDDGSTWVPAPACLDGGTSSAWCPTFTPTGEGEYQIAARAIDQVGNVGAVSTTRFLVDATPPTITFDTPAADQEVSLRRDPTDKQTLLLDISGRVSDPPLANSNNQAGSGVREIEVVLRDSNGRRVGDGPILRPTQGPTWTLVYTISEPNLLGRYTIEALARDQLGNQGRSTRTVYFNTVGPLLAVTASLSTATVLSSTARFSGRITPTLSGSPQGGSLGSVELAFESPTFFSASNPQDNVAGAFVHLPLNDMPDPQGVLAALDLSGNERTARCEGEGCPDYGVSAPTGSGMAFDGAQQVLQLGSLDTLSGTLTLAAWVKVEDAGTPDSQSAQSIIARDSYLAFQLVAPTATPTSIPTATPTSTPTATPTSTPTATPTSTAGGLATATPTSTAGGLATATPTSTATPTTVPTEEPTIEPSDDDGIFWFDDLFLWYTDEDDEDFFFAPDTPNTELEVAADEPASDEFVFVVAPEISLQIANGTYRVGSSSPFEGGQDAFAVAPIPASDRGQWVHLIGTYDGSRWRLYRNGVELASSEPLAALPSSPAPWSVGAFPDSRDPLRGSLADVRIYTRTLNLAEREALYVGTAPALQLDFEAAALGNNSALRDPIRQSDVATLSTGAADAATKTTTGQVGRSALQFDGVDDSVQIPAPPQLANRSFSISFWAQQQRGGEAWVLAQGTAATNQGLHVGFRSDTSFTCAFWNNDLDVTIPASRAWHHWTCSYDAARGTQRIYRDGQLLDQRTGVAAYQGSGTMTLGLRPFGTSAPFAGNLDQLQIHPRAISADEVRNLYLAGWQTASITPDNRWTGSIPTNVEGFYRAWLRGSDADGNRLADPAIDSFVWQGILDTRPPRISIERTSSTVEDRTNYRYTVTAQDFNIEPDTLRSPCGSDTSLQIVSVQRYQADWYRGLLGNPTAVRPYALTATCTSTAAEATDQVTVCDSAGNCATARYPATAPDLPFEVAADDPPPTARLLFDPLPAVVTSTARLTVSGIATALVPIEALTITIDQQPIYTATTGLTATSSWATAWQPPADGNYRLAASLRDADGAVLNSEPVHITVDTRAPNMSITRTLLTQRDYAGGRIVAAGRVQDTSGIARLEANLQELPAVAMTTSITDTLWQARWIPDVALLPDNRQYTLLITATDVAGWQQVLTRTFTVDVVPPVLPLPDLRIAGSVVPTGTLITDPQVTVSLTVPARTDGSGINRFWYGWTDTLTPELRSLQLLTGTAAADPLRLQSVLTAPLQTGGQPWYFHTIATDRRGNPTIQRWGPLYHDPPQAPDYLSLNEPAGPRTGLPYRGWLGNRCTLIGEDLRPAVALDDGTAVLPAQQLSATWDTNAMHLTWAGADWDTDGDLFIYLDTIPDQAAQGDDPYIRRGGNIAFNPYTETLSSTALLLPIQEQGINDELPNRYDPAAVMNADYALWVSDSSTVTLLRWDATTDTWEAVAPPPAALRYRMSREQTTTYTDLVLPFALIGINRAQAPQIGLVAFTTADYGLALWSAIPPTNILNQDLFILNQELAEPHQHILTNRATISLADGDCRTASGRISAPTYGEPAGFSYDFTDDTVRLSVQAEADNALWQGFLAAYETPFEDGLAAYCTTFPDAPECLADARTSDVAGSADVLLESLMDTTFTPVAPGQSLTYTILIRNDTRYPLTNVWVNAFSFDTADQEAVAWQQACGAVNVGSVPAGATVPVSLTARATGELINIATQVLRDVTYDLDGCSATSLLTSDGTLTSTNIVAAANINYPKDSGPPQTVVLDSPRTLLNPTQNLLRGSVVDDLPLRELEIELQGASGNPERVRCPAPETQPGRWQCPLDLAAALGRTPVDGEQVSLRLRATDALTQTSDWSRPYSLLVDATRPTIELASELAAALAGQRLAVGTPALYGTSSDNRQLANVEVCGPLNDTCVTAELVPETPEPQTTYRLVDVPPSPLPIGSGACPAGGLERSFTLTDTLTIEQVRVGVAVEHPYRGDLSIELVSPQGTRVALVADSGDDSASNYNLLLSDQGDAGGTRDHSLTPPFFRYSRVPATALDTLRGESGTGTWRLVLCDNEPTFDAGQYLRSQIEIDARRIPAATRGRWYFNLNELLTENVVDGQAGSFQIFASDAVGNRQTTPLILPVVIDTVAPQLSLTRALTRTSVISGLTVLEGRVSDGDRVRDVVANILQPDGSRVRQPLTVAADGRWQVVLQSEILGDYEITVVASDASGNSTTLASVPVLLEAQPLIEGRVELLAVEAYQGVPFQLAASVAPVSSTGQLQYRWEPEPMQGQGTAVATYLSTGTGSFPVVVSISNERGAVQARRTMTIRPPAIQLAASNTVLAPTQSLVLTVTGEPELPTTARLQLDWGDSSPLEETSRTQIITESLNGGGLSRRAFILQHAYALSGTYRITGRLFADSDVYGGAPLATATLTVSVVRPPDGVLPIAPQQVVIAGVTSSRIGATDRFTATVLPDDATQPLSYTWQPRPQGGQGTAVVSYTWATAGTQPITLTVRNGSGAVTTTRQVQVLADGEIEITPTTSGVVQVGGSTGITLTLRAGTVTETLTLRYRELVAPSVPLSNGLRFAGRAFVLEAYRNGVRLVDNPFQQPLTVELATDPAQVLDPAQVRLYRLSSTQQWVVQPVPRGLAQVLIQAQIQDLGEFALAELAPTLSTQRTIYLPLIARQ